MRQEDKNTEKYFDINEQGFSVRCKVYAKDVHNIRRAVIFGHGFGGHKDNHVCARFAEQTTSRYKDVGVFAFDWPCHGMDARNRLVLADCDAYLSIVLGTIRKTFGTEDICVYATSFGGYLTLKYITDHGNPFRRIALRCPAVGMHDVLLHIIHPDELAKLEKGKDVLIGFDRKVKVNKAFFEEVAAADIRQRDFLDYADFMMIWHGTGDEIVPYESVRKFADDNVIEFIPVEGVDHRFRDPQKLDRVHQEILKFFAF